MVKTIAPHVYSSARSVSRNRPVISSGESQRDKLGTAHNTSEELWREICPMTSSIVPKGVLAHNRSWFKNGNLHWTRSLPGLKSEFIQRKRPTSSGRLMSARCSGTLRSHHGQWRGRATPAASDPDKRRRAFEPWKYLPPDRLQPDHSGVVCSDTRADSKGKACQLGAVRKSPGTWPLEAVSARRRGLGHLVSRLEKT